MPDISQVAFFKRTESAFVSPFTDTLPAVLYSSIVIPRAKETSACIDCAVLNLKQAEIQEFLIQTAQANQLASLRSPYFFNSDPKYSETLPTIPPLEET